MGRGGDTDYKLVNRQAQMAMGTMENKARSRAVGRNNGGGGGLYRVISLSDLGITGSWAFRKRLWGTEPEAVAVILASEGGGLAWGGRCSGQMIIV